MTTRGYTYDPDEGEFVDFATLEDWEARDKEQRSSIEELQAKLADAVEALEGISRRTDLKSDRKWSENLREPHLRRLLGLARQDAIKALATLKGGEE